LPLDSAEAALYRALTLEATGSPPWRGWGISIAGHAFFLLPLLVGLPRGDREALLKKQESVTRIFVPLPGTPARLPRPPIAKLKPTRVEEAPAAASLVSVDLSEIGLSFSPDVRSQLPAVVEMHGGALALLDKENPSVARYILRPPLWRAEPVTADVTGKLRLLMDPPEDWPVLRQIAQREGIDLSEYLASALFDISYRKCLQEAIRDRIPARASGRVSSASLRFNSDRACGVEALQVSLAP
jgi:hypothetical protein